jgi:hypothetical protein
MALPKGPTPAAPAATTGVSFEVERFAWADGRLEVAGRWYGIRGRRFLRPTLDVELDGAARRMLAVLEHKPWAADDGEKWVAAFEWAGDPVELAGAELAVGPDLAVELPSPSGAPAKRKSRARDAGERLEARPPRAQALEAELAAARAEIEELRERLVAKQRARKRRVDQLDALRQEANAARSAAETERDEARAARDAAVSQRDELAAARDTAVSDRNELMAAGAAAVAARDEALAESAKSTAERDKAKRERAALSEELAAAVRARDKARAERNEWMTRARTAEAPPAREAPASRSPEPPGHETKPAARAPASEPPASARDRSEDPPSREGRPAASAPRATAKQPRKSQIPPGGILLPPTGPGSHMRRSIMPGWAPRALAPIALVLLVVFVALLISWAF